MRPFFRYDTCCGIEVGNQIENHSGRYFHLQKRQALKQALDGFMGAPTFFVKAIVSR